MEKITGVEMDAGVAVVTEAIHGLVDIVENYENQKTLRYEVRKKCELAAKIIDANTEVLKLSIETSREERSRLLDIVEKICLTQSIDESAVMLAERLLCYLESTSAVATLKASPQMPMLW